MGLEGRALASAVGGKLVLLLLAWAVGAGVTACFAGEAFILTADYVEKASEDADSVIPILSAAGLALLLFVVAAFVREKNARRYAAEYSAEVAGDLGSLLFLGGFTVLMVFAAKHGLERGVLGAGLFVLGILLVTASKRFGA